MENEKIKRNVDEAETNFHTMYPENPELSQVFMLKGIGYALLAIVELLQEVRKIDGQAKPAPQGGE